MTSRLVRGWPNEMLEVGEATHPRYEAGLDLRNLSFTPARTSCRSVASKRLEPSALCGAVDDCHHQRVERGDHQIRARAFPAKEASASGSPNVRTSSLRSPPSEKYSPKCER